MRSKGRGRCLLFTGRHLVKRRCQSIQFVCRIRLTPEGAFTEHLEADKTFKAVMAEADAMAGLAKRIARAHSAQLLSDAEQAVDGARKEVDDMTRLAAAALQIRHEAQGKAQKAAERLKRLSKRLQSTIATRLTSWSLRLTPSTLTRQRAKGGGIQSRRQSPWRQEARRAIQGSARRANPRVRTARPAT